ncbi:hypothetical protein ALC57_05847, partial [Trachymyrmex cornetzi]
NVPPHPLRYMPTPPSNQTASKKGDGKTQQRLHGVSEGMSGYSCDEGQAFSNRALTSYLQGTSPLW